MNLTANNIYIMHTVRRTQSRKKHLRDAAEKKLLGRDTTDQSRDK